MGLLLGGHRGKPVQVSVGSEVITLSGSSGGGGGGGVDSSTPTFKK